MSKTQILCHIVFGTRARRPSLLPVKRIEVYRYIYGVIKSLNCHLIRLNGIEDHVHMLIDLHPTVSLADLVKKVKQSSSHWIKESGLLVGFDGWGRGYFAVSVSPEHREAVKQYIINQEEHHRGQAYADELKEMIEALGMTWYPDEWE